MKTAISIPDDLFRKADRLARQRGISRSQLYAEALRRFLTDDQQQAIIARFNEVYAGVQEPLAPAVRLAQSRAIGKEQW